MYVVAAITLACGACSTDDLVPLRLIFPAAANSGREVVTQFDQLYAERGGQKLFYDLYRPVVSDQPAPLVIVIHGGFWRSGTRKDVAEFSYDIAAHGYLVASIDYRLAQNGVVYPAPVTDVLAAIRFFREQAAVLNIDPDRVALFGRSAGAHLALLAGMTSDSSVFDPERPAGETTNIRAIVSVSGPTDLTADISTATQLQIDTVENFFGKKIGEIGDTLRVASPVTYARSDGPPVLIIHGDLDDIVPVNQAHRLAAALNTAGQPNVLRVFSGMDHLINSLWYTGFAQQYRVPIMDFLRSNL